MSNCPVTLESLGTRRRLSSPLIFGVHTLTLTGFLAASSAPTPLYPLYQQQWSLSPTVLSVIFAAYSLALLLALLVMGRLSDYIGRRPVIALALALQSGALLGFLYATGPGWLIAARLLQGFATGMATAAVGAALLDISRERGTLINSFVPMMGLAVGVLGSTALVVHTVEPIRTVYVLLLGLSLLSLVLTGWVPETVKGQRGAWASLKPNLIVPQQARRAFLLVTPVNIAVWMLGGLYLSLMPSLIQASMNVDTPWLGGLVVAALTLTGASAVVAGRKLSAFYSSLIGTLTLIAGMALILSGANQGDSTRLLLGSVIGGFGFGVGFLGAVRSVLPLAEPHQRAALMAVFYTQCYLANSLPTIALGYLARRTGLLTAVNVYGALIIVLAVLSLALLILQAKTYMKKGS